MRLRPSLLVAVASTAIAIFACSNSDNPDLGESDPDGGPSTLPDGGGPDGSTDAAADARREDAAIRECSDQGFCHSVLPPSETLRGVWGDGQGIVWAVSESGHVLRWDGTAWSIHTSTVDNSFLAIWGSGPTDIWLLGSTGLMHGTGASSANIVFVPVDAPGDPKIKLTALWGLGANDVWAVGGEQSTENGEFPYPAQGRIVHYTGPAKGWILDNTDPIAFNIVWGTPNSGVWTAGTIEAKEENEFSIEAVVRRKLPGATKWTEVTLPPDPDPRHTWTPDPLELRVAGFSSDSSVWIVGLTQEGTRLYYHGTSTDNGQTFTWKALPRVAWDLDLNAVWGTGANDTWAVGEYGRLRRWDGTTWQQAAIMVSHVPVTNPLYAIWGKSSEDFWVVGRDIALHKTAGGQAQP